MDLEPKLQPLRDKNHELFKKLDSLKSKLGLEKLYLICLVPKQVGDFPEVAWGARNAAGVDEEAVQREFTVFLKENFELECPEEKIIILDNPYKETDYVLGINLLPYIQSHGGSLEVISADE